MNKQCKNCDNNSDWAGIEYAYGCKERYDGVSEWRCTKCNTRYGRWTNKILKGDEVEPVFGREI